MLFHQNLREDFDMDKLVNQTLAIISQLKKCFWADNFRGKMFYWQKVTKSFAALYFVGENFDR